MKKRFSVEQITAVLKQAETGIAVGDVSRQAGVSEQSFDRWRKVWQPSGAGNGGQCPTATTASMAMAAMWFL